MTDTATGLAPLEFSVTRNLAARSDAQREELLKDPGFGTVFTDHTVDICWSEKGGWHRPRVQPYGPIPLDPAASVLHYGQEIFEGIKAYRHADGSIHTFRPDRNAERLLGRAHDQAVLTVTEEARESASASVINFEVLDGMVRFDVSLTAAQTAGLGISARLLQVAARVTGEP